MLVGTQGFNCSFVWRVRTTGDVITMFPTVWGERKKIFCSNAEFKPVADRIQTKCTFLKGPFHLFSKWSSVYLSNCFHPNEYFLNYPLTWQWFSQITFLYYSTWAINCQKIIIIQTIGPHHFLRPRWRMENPKISSLPLLKMCGCSFKCERKRKFWHFCWNNSSIIATLLNKCSWDRGFDWLEARKI